MMSTNINKIVRRNKESIVDRMRRYTVRDGESGCLEWIGACSSSGYGHMTIEGKTLKAHRVAMVLNGATLSPGDNVCHKCDNTICVDPSHLFVGDQKENVYDCIAKKRRLSKMTPDRVVRLRAMRSKGASYPVLARIFNVTAAVARRIAIGQYWSDVK